MKEIEITNSILKTVSEELSTWLKEKDSITSGYEYEDRVIKMGQRITQEILLRTMGKVPKSRNQKKTSNVSRPN